MAKTVRLNKNRLYNLIHECVKTSLKHRLNEGDARLDWVTEFIRDRFDNRTQVPKPKEDNSNNNQQNQNNNNQQGQENQEPQGPKMVSNRFNFQHGGFNPRHFGDRCNNKVKYNPPPGYNASDYYVNGNEETTWIEYLLMHFRHTFDAMGNDALPFIKGLARIAYRDLEFEITDSHTDDIEDLVDMMQVIKSNSEYSKKFRKGVELEDKFIKKAQEDMAQGKTPKYIPLDQQINFRNLKKWYMGAVNQARLELRRKVKAKEYVRSKDYTILPLNTQQECWKYAQYTGWRNENGEVMGPLCYGQYPGTWYDYAEGNTCDEGRNQCYVALKNGWQDVPCPSPEQINSGEIENFPFDKYGLSMIFFFVRKSHKDTSRIGRLTACNVRWNHGCGDCNLEDPRWKVRADHALNEEQLSDILGLNIYKLANKKNLNEARKSYLMEQRRRKNRKSRYLR